MMEEKTDITEEKQTDKPWLFKKGQSGNPAGRPVGSISIIAEIKKQLEEIADEDPQKRTKLQLMVRKILLKAINDGDTNMIKDIIDRVHGKPSQPIDLGTDDEVWDKLKEIQEKLKLNEPKE